MQGVNVDLERDFLASLALRPLLKDTCLILVERESSLKGKREDV